MKNYLIHMERADLDIWANTREELRSVLKKLAVRAPEFDRGNIKVLEKDYRGCYTLMDSKLLKFIIQDDVKPLKELEKGAIVEVYNKSSNYKCEFLGRHQGSDNYLEGEFTDENGKLVGVVFTGPEQLVKVIKEGN